MENIYIGIYDAERIKEFADFLTAAVERGDYIEMTAMDFYGTGELEVRAGKERIEF
jgi:hypothetical protein